MSAEATEGWTPRVFLSYSYESSAEEAAQLSEGLRARRVRLLDHHWDVERVAYEQVSERISEADLIVVLLKPGDEDRPWVEIETRLMLRAGWSRPELRVAVVAAAVGAIPSALRHQRFVYYFPHDEVRLEAWRDRQVVDSFVDRLLSVREGSVPSMPEEQIKEWRDRVVHVAGHSPLNEEEWHRLRAELVDYLHRMNKPLTRGELHDPSVARPLLDRAVLATALGDSNLTSAYYELAKAVMARTGAGAQTQGTNAQYRLALVAHVAGDLATAERLLDAAVNSNRHDLGEHHPATIAAMYSLGAVEAEAGDEDASRTYEAALQLARDSLGDLHPQTAAIAFSLGVLCEQLGELERARHLFELAANAYRHVRPDDSDELQAAVDHLASLGEPGP
jgi:tetratricopeptide (TPR) repeat protein